MTEPDTLRAQLSAGAHPQGGWGYGPDQWPQIEPTCLALLALPVGDAHPRALAWIETNACDDGTYRPTRGRREAAWGTALVVFTRHVLGHTGLEGPTRALLALRGRTFDLSDNHINDVDNSLTGWPWGEGNFSWVEPTAWAILALRHMGQDLHQRVIEGQRLLLDRVLPDGGLNYGNRCIFGVSLEPIPTPTALALLALQGVNDPRIDRTLDYLQRLASFSTDVEHLAWAILALDVHGRMPALDDMRRRLIDACRARQQLSYVRPAMMHLALTCLALDTTANPFRLPRGRTVPLLEAGRLNSESKPLNEVVHGWVQGVSVLAQSAFKPLWAQTEVHIAPAEDYSVPLADILARQYESFRGRVPLKGKRVVLKPNLVEYHRDKVINTDPRLVAAVIELCRREGAAEILVAEGPGHWRNAEHLVKESGLGEVLRTYQVPFVDLNHDEPVRRINPARLTKLPHLYLTRTIVSADVVISLPKLKTHHWAVATLSLKNLFGTLPGVCYGWPKNEMHWRGIHNSIVDIAATRTPDLAIVDGVVGMEGDGPLNGTPRQMGVIIMGNDLVAVDATCCRLMRLEPMSVPYLTLAHQKKIGLLAEAQIRQVGETIEARARPFDTVPSHKPHWVGPRAKSKKCDA